MVGAQLQAELLENAARIHRMVTRQIWEETEIAVHVR